MNIFSVAKRSILGLVGAAAITASIAAPAFAANDVTQVINSSGTLSASVANATMSPINYSDSAGTTTGTLGLSVVDHRGTAAGWNVTIASSDFVYGGTSEAGADIPKAGFVITAVGDPSVVSGQPIVAGSGPRSVSAGVGALDTPKKTIQANPGSGSGSYTQSLPVSLQIPAYSQAGVYTAVLTVFISNGP